MLTMKGVLIGRATRGLCAALEECEVRDNPDFSYDKSKRNGVWLPRGMAENGELHIQSTTFLKEGG